MPHLLRFSRELEARLDLLAERTGMTKAALIERLVSEGAEVLEAELAQHGAGSERAERSIDQLLRESGLGA
ncbi:MULTISPECIES: ribbon-helix-helix protein, CopG family [Halomonas]|uniref:ribbon-helix-helix protein, CopG family n=1 Tax=Halomonas TaxID=2745 RepID=UPI001A8C11EE|nr:MULTISPECIES: ribbon-helix-helix protein, CopG family [Halomonas]MBN8411338.1 ribbon-helix-helix protein, CopG family [Halomonas litopenaei]MBY5985294.1 ribbon-helix-helix protein, CopG family [Halomonas sp. DP5Y7-2]MBY6207121.1 ribbon-helix-helix protein, CopG family [Halomonas sp. DP3Y7-2]MBY6229715.1 ribbon-helix-helix protein, CopG family [Halomonas sp. DP3Y7-1]MCA0917953.1 ribbon-helix-helix protein, CopG family [Halomonas denitrificans]